MPKYGTEKETRLAYRVRMLDAAEREELMARSGLSRTTLYARLKAPGKLTLDEATAITRFLEELDDVAYDLTMMLLPMDIGTCEPAK